MPVVFQVIGSVVSARSHLRHLKANQLCGEIAVLEHHICIIPLHHARVDKLRYIGAHLVLHQYSVHREAVNQVRLHTQILPVIMDEHFFHCWIIEALLGIHAGNVDSLLQKRRLNLSLCSGRCRLLCQCDFVSWRPGIDGR